MSRQKVAVGILIFVAASLALLGLFVYRWLSPNAIEVTATDEETATDSWLRWVPESPDGNQWEEIPEKRFSAVESASQAEAIRRLNDVPFVELSDKGLKNFAPTLLPRPDGLNPYLIRGVIFQGYFFQGEDGRWTGTGSFKCYHRGKDVSVSFGCLGRKSRGMGKQPLVILLPSQPEEVFVGCSMAE